MKTWEVNAQLNWDTSNRKTIIIKANTERKAKILAEKQYIKEGAFAVLDMRLKERKEEE